MSELVRATASVLYIKLDSREMGSDPSKYIGKSELIGWPQILWARPTGNPKQVFSSYLSSINQSHLKVFNFGQIMQFIPIYNI